MIREIEEYVRRGDVAAEGSKNKMKDHVEERVHYDVVTAESSKNNPIKSQSQAVNQNYNLGARKDENVNRPKSALEIFGTNLTKFAQEVT